MIWLRFMRWWSLKPFIDKGVDHFRGTTRDERHFEFLHAYWSHRLAGCGHGGSLMLARMELRLLRVRDEAREARRRTTEESRKLAEVLSHGWHDRRWVHDKPRSADDLADILGRKCDQISPGSRD